MSDRYYLTDGSHVLISGPTGAGDRYGGKSSTANWWAEYLVQTGTVETAIYVDAGNFGYNGRTYESPQGLAQGYQSGQRQLVWRGPTSEVEGLVTFADSLSEPVCMVFDEAWMYPESEGMIDVVRNLGNQSNPIRGLVVSQRAWDLPDSIRNSCPLKVWVGPMTNEGENYFQAEGMGHIAEQYDPEPYHWLVTDGGEPLHVNPPVSEAYA